MINVVIAYTNVNSDDERMIPLAREHAKNAKLRERVSGRDEKERNWR